MASVIAPHDTTPAGLAAPAWARSARGRLTRQLAAACIAVLGGSVHAVASVHALPAPVQAPIERATLNAASPHAPGPDNPAREKILNTLRSMAQGDGTPPRKPRAPAARSAADLPPADAAWLLGLLALHGLAMPANPPQAQHWFERAQMLGHPLAPAGLAWCQLSGCVAPPNPAAALPWIAVVRRTHAALAKYLEWHAAKALAPLTEPNPAPPRRDTGRDARHDPGRDAGRDTSALASPASSPALLKLLTEASRAGSAQATNELGLEYLASGDLDKAAAQFQAASARSAAAAANASLLASRLHVGAAERTRPAAHSAADWYAEAQRYHRGDGVPANYAEAVRLYQIAASSGDAQARRMLALIFSRPAPDGTVDVAWMQQLASVETGPSGLPRAAAKPLAPHGWQRDPTPLYELVPPEWRAPPR
ncbi:SEL1-like repeat protein [Acidovorax sp. LjRoot129]|uniref:SEL1-like repeat protein n=1 Tax=Acidovorax sp. LjRoot129 TaxID=3342260 RepID=UPI003ECDAB77